MAERRHVNHRTGEIKDDPVIRPFADFLRDQSQGKTHEEMGEALYDLVARVRDTGKKGSLTLVLTVEPMKDAPELLIVGDEIKLKLPEYPRKPSLFYEDDNGNLTRKNPMQPELFVGLREVADGIPDPQALRDAK